MEKLLKPILDILIVCAMHCIMHILVSDMWPPTLTQSFEKQDILLI